MLVDTIKMILFFDVYLVLNRNVGNNNSIWMTLYSVLLLPLLVSVGPVSWSGSRAEKPLCSLFPEYICFEAPESSRLKQWLCLVALLFLLWGEENRHLKMCRYWKLGNQWCFLRNKFFKLNVCLVYCRLCSLTVGCSSGWSLPWWNLHHSGRQRSLIWVLWEKDKC